MLKVEECATKESSPSLDLLLQFQRLLTLDLVYFRNSSSHSQSRLHDLSRNGVLKVEECATKESSPSLDLLLQFQRLLTLDLVFFRNSSSHSQSRLHDLSRNGVLKVEECATKESSPSLDLLLQFQRLLTLDLVFFRNSSSHSQSRLHDLSRNGVLKVEECATKESSPSLDLLLQFQRLLIARVFPKHNCYLASQADIGQSQFVLVFQSQAIWVSPQQNLSSGFPTK